MLVAENFNQIIFKSFLLFVAGMSFRKQMMALISRIGNTESVAQEKVVVNGLV